MLTNVERWHYLCICVFVLAYTMLMISTEFCHMSLLSTQELAARAGISRRQCQRLVKLGLVPGTQRTAGKHWIIPDVKEVRQWAKTKSEERSEVFASHVTDTEHYARVRNLQKGVTAGEALLREQPRDQATQRLVSSAIDRLRAALVSATRGYN